MLVVTRPCPETAAKKRKPKGLCDGHGFLKAKLQTPSPLHRLATVALCCVYAMPHQLQLLTGTHLILPQVQPLCFKLPLRFVVFAAVAVTLLSLPVTASQTVREITKLNEGMPTRFTASTVCLYSLPVTPSQTAMVAT